jgi:antitoxin component YwqK of YwqJK toxin-antitoxin module
MNSKAVLLFVIICFFLNENTAQNKLDASGRKFGKWVFTGKDHPSSNYAENHKVEEGNFINGRKEGIWLRYHKDGKIPKLKGNYRNNRPEGFYIRYFRNAKKMEEATFIQNKYKGNCIRYYSNGVVAYKGNYNNSGKESGRIQYFHKNGKLQLEYLAKKGRPFGTIKHYYRNGSLKYEIKLDDTGEKESVVTYEPSLEKPVESMKDKSLRPPSIISPNTRGVRFSEFGYNKVYNKNDEIWMDGTFRNGSLWDGKVYEYDIDGIIMKVKVYKKGKYHSDGQF